MVNVSSSISLCMEGLRGTVPFRLPSGGIARLHWYYPSIRLPALRLSSSVSCRTYRTDTPCTEICRPSPVDVMSLCGMADFKPRSAVRNLTITINPHVAFHFPNSVGALVIRPFVAKMPFDPATLLPLLCLRYCYRMLWVATDDVVSILPDGISTR